jgi:RND family efflux transporter MFP subunit
MHIKTYYIGLAALCLALCASCQSSSSPAGEDHDYDGHEQAEGGHAENSDEIVLTPEKARAAGVVVETLQKQPFTPAIHAGGQILGAQGEEQQLSAHVAGIVHLTRALNEGQSVAKGQALMTIQADRLPDGNPAERARITYEQAKAAYERGARLVEQQIISRKEYERLKAEYDQARLSYEALASQSSKSGLTVTAPLAGYLLRPLVKEGDYVEVGQPLVSVARSTRLRLQADVPAKYYNQLATVRSANFKTSYDDTVYSLSGEGGLDGRLLAYGRSADDASGYIPVTFEFEGRGGIVPGSYVEVWITAQADQSALVVPQSAITEEQGLHFAYVQLDKEGYQRREVTLGGTDGQRFEILSGLNEGDKVVTRGAIHVKLASASNAIPAHTHEH